MFLGYLRQGHPGATILNNLLSVNVEPSTTDLPSFKTRPPHPCTNALDDDASLQFCHCRHNDENCPTERSLSIYRFSLAQELNSKPIQFVDGLEQVLRRTRQSFARPNEQYVELVSAGIVHHPVEFGSPRPDAREPVVGVLADDLESPMGSELPKLT